MSKDLLVQKNVVEIVVLGALGTRAVVASTVAVVTAHELFQAWQSLSRQGHSLGLHVLCPCLFD